MEKFTNYLQTEDKDAIISAIEHVYRRLLANLLLDIDNKNFRTIKKSNSVIARHITKLRSDFAEFLFHTLGFQEDESNSNILHFVGTYDDLLKTDRLISTIEATFSAQTLAGFPSLKTKLEHRQIADTSVRELKSERSAESDSATSGVNAPFFEEDYSTVADLCETVRHTLLNTGRIRNCFFQAKDFSLRRMSHGRVYFCSEKCPAWNLEAHWHVLSGKGLLYSYVAHLSGDGKSLLHLGSEYGYQYNAIPGTEFFGKTVCFSEKLTTPDGTLKLNRHPNKPATSCIYCGTEFAKLFL